jgi:hypothetical protein
MTLRSLKDNFWFQISLLFAAIFLFTGKPVPYGNEPVYLLRLVKTYQPQFLVNDIAFSTTASEHWLYNHIFGILPLFFSVQTFAWLGRISVWIILLTVIFRLAKHWEIPNWSVSLSIFAWLAIGQTIVNGEWIFGGFEAKNLAYICLLFSLDYFVRKREIVASVLLGLSFSFHPAVGLWAILAVGIAILFERWSIKQLTQVVVITGCFALIGAVHLFGETIANADDWKFFVTVRAPDYLDPFYWLFKGYVVLALMFAFCFLANWNSFLKKFLAALGIFFIIGIALRFFEQWQLLCLMPMRLFPVIIPLFFFFTLAKCHKQKSFSTSSAFIAILVFVSILWWQKSELTPIMQLRDTYQAWTAKVDDETKTYIWLRENTPAESVSLTPPNNRFVWFYSERSQFVSFSYPPFEKMTNWRERLTKIIGDKTESDAMATAYNNLSEAEIRKLADENQLHYLVSKTNYNFKKMFESGNWNVYELKNVREKN